MSGEAEAKRCAEAERCVEMSVADAAAKALIPDEAHRLKHASVVSGRDTACWGYLREYIPDPFHYAVFQLLTVR
jgi:hypothetical protein